MRTPLFLLAVTLLLGAQAKPQGIYHAESSYHSSAKSYRNNELQHQNEDDAFYSEDGDTEHKTKPKVNSYSQHSEYVNPKLRTGEYSNVNQGIDSGLFEAQRAGSSYDSAYKGAGSKTSSYGQAISLEELTRRLQADLSRQLQSAVSEQYSRSSAYSHSSTQMNHDLTRFENELRANLTRKLQEALYEAYGQQATRGPYSYSITRGEGGRQTANYNVQDLENLKSQVENNLVNQLQQEVRTQYEASESRSSYSSNQNRGSGYRPVALTADNPYSGVKTVGRPAVYYPSSRYPSSADQTGSFLDTSGNYPSNRYPSNIDQTGSFSDTSNSYGSSSNNYASASTSTVTYRLNDVVHEVQLELARVIDDILKEEQQKNTELIERGIRPNYQDNFQFLRQSLIRNISNRIDEKINRYYGNQIERNDNFYSLTASGIAKTQPNYSRDYLESLKQQIEDNLVEKLSYGIRQQETRYDEESRPYTGTQYRPAYSGYGTNSQSSSSSSSTFNSASQYGVSGVAPLNSPTSSDYYNSRTPNHPDSEVELTNIQQQLQNDLSRQLQYAIREQTKEYSTYASSGGVGSSNYQTALQQLTEELKRNLTQQLQRYMNERRNAASLSSSSYAHSSGSQARYNQQALEDVSRNLQSNLLRQLQDGLRQSWSSEYSYSASGSYTRPTSYSGGVKGHSQSYTQYGEDCDESGDYNSHYRAKRELVLRNRANQNDLTQQLEDFGYYQQQHDGLTQQQEDVFGVYGQKDLEDLTQQQDDDFYSNQQQQAEIEPLENKPGFGATVQQQPSEKFQNAEELDEQQQQLEDTYGNLEFGALLRQKRTTTEASTYIFQQQQQQSEDGLTQQLEDEDVYGNLYSSRRPQQQQIYGRRPNSFQQQVYPARNLVQQQQVEDIYGNLETSTTRKPQGRFIEFGEDLTQQQETEDIYGNLQLGKTTQKPRNLQFGSQYRVPKTETDINVQQQSELTQQQEQQQSENIFGRRPETEGLTQQQQTEDIYGNLELGSLRTTTKPRYYGSNYGSSSQLSNDFTQQQETEDIYGNLHFGRTTQVPSNLQFGSQYREPKTTTDLNFQQQQSDLTQQQSQDAFGRRPESADLTQQQQTEDIYGNLGLSSTKPNRNPDAEDLTQQQQTEDIYGNLGLDSKTTRRPSYYQQNVPQAVNMYGRKPIEAADLTHQQNEDVFGRKPEYTDLTQQQQTEEIYQPLQFGLRTSTTKRPGYYHSLSADLTQQQETEDIYGNLQLGSRSSTTAKPSFFQQSDDLTQQQQTEDIYGNLEIGSLRTTKIPSLYKPVDSTQQQQQENVEPLGVVPLTANQQQLEDGFSNLEIASQTKPSSNNQIGLAQHTENGFDSQSGLTQQLENGFEGYSQQSQEEPIGRQDGSPSYYPPGYQGPRTSPYGRSSQRPILSQYTVQQAQQKTIEDSSEEVEDLVQKPVEKHTAYEVYDVSSQAKVKEPEPLQEQKSVESLEQEEVVQPQPGFWKRVGNKITNAYGNVRDKAKEVFG